MTFTGGLIFPLRFHGYLTKEGIDSDNQLSVLISGCDHIAIY
jgi:hypothetical protein